MPIVYVAGPLFCQAERSFLESLVDTLAASSGLDPQNDFFLPHRDTKQDPDAGFRRETVFSKDMKSLEAASIVIALLDGHDSDSGTCVELGYAYSTGKKIFGLLTDFRAGENDLHRPNIMVWGICEEGRTLYMDVASLATAFAAYLRERPSRMRPQRPSSTQKEDPGLGSPGPEGK